MDGWDKGVSVQAGWVGRSRGRMHGGMVGCMDRRDGCMVVLEGRRGWREQTDGQMDHGVAEVGRGY